MQDSTTNTVRKLAYPYFVDAPPTDASIYRTMWAIERQLSLASDYDEADLVAVLSAMNPDFDESIGADIDTLFDLSDEVERCRLALNSQAFYAAQDDYLSHLRALAHLVRGTKNFSPVRRPRHVLGATS